MRCAARGYDGVSLGTVKVGSEAGQLQAPRVLSGDDDLRIYGVTHLRGHLRGQVLPFARPLCGAAGEKGIDGQRRQQARTAVGLDRPEAAMAEGWYQAKGKT
jgi:hypothetical protein